MSCYIIAGSADKSETAECELYVNFIHEKYPNIPLKIIIKHPNEWPKFLSDICKTYGFKKPSNPIIYKMDGLLIGDYEAFKAHLHKFFGLDIHSLDDKQRNEEINMRFADEEFNNKQRKIRKDRYLHEEIEDKIEQLFDLKKLSIPKGFFKEEIIKGKRIFTKLNEKLTKEIIQNELTVSVFLQEKLKTKIDVVYDLIEIGKKDVLLSDGTLPILRETIIKGQTKTEISQKGDKGNETKSSEKSRPVTRDPEIKNPIIIEEESLNKDQDNDDKIEIIENNLETEKLNDQEENIENELHISIRDDSNENIIIPIFNEEEIISFPLEEIEHPRIYSIDLFVYKEV